MRRNTNLIVVMIVASLITVSGFVALGETLGDATVTLQSRRYYSKWNLTRFVYRVTSPKSNVPTCWILGTGSCLAEDQIDTASSTAFTWNSDPIIGLRFSSYTSRDRFYLWLNGQWDVGSVDAAVILDDGSIHQGTIDGPLCEGSSISIEVTAGASVEFPQLLGAGSFSANMTTRLVVASTSSGWHFGYSPTFLIPEHAQQSVVERVLKITVAPHGSGSGTTELTVSYELDVTEQDFVGLPEGTYMIGIVYTVIADD
jgi:hypothetical protein